MVPGTDTFSGLFVPVTLTASSKLIVVAKLVNCKVADVTAPPTLKLVLPLAIKSPMAIAPDPTAPPIVMAPFTAIRFRSLPGLAASTLPVIPMEPLLPT